MKQKISILLLATYIFLCPKISAQGKYTSTFKRLIGTTFSNEKHIAGLPGYKFTQGELITDIRYWEAQFIDVYVKGTTAVVIYSSQIDSAVKKYAIIDIIEIKGILKDWDVKTTGCMYGQTEGEIIVALVKRGSKQYAAAVKKAWLCNRDKLRFEEIAAGNIKCLNEGEANE